MNFQNKQNWSVSSFEGPPTPQKKGGILKMLKSWSNRSFWIYLGIFSLFSLCLSILVAIYSIRCGSISFEFIEY